MKCMTSRLAATVGAALVAGLVPGLALAYTQSTTSSCPGGYEQDGDHTWSFQEVGVPEATEPVFQDTAEMMMERINFVGGQSFDFGLPMPSIVDTPENTDNDIDEIGMKELAHSADSITLGLTSNWVSRSTCKIVESDVALTNYVDWIWGVPADVGEDYFDVANSVGGDYFARPVLMHELLHALGLSHSDHSYAQMNYNDRPWSNRDDAKRVEPLPDDREGLRDIYPAATEETDVAVLNTWYDSGDLSNGAAKQKLLCKPAVGSAYSSSIFDDYCAVEADGTDGSVEVCPGDSLRVRYAVANYGTTAVDVDAEAWFSINTNLDRDAGADKVSVDVRSLATSAQSSYREGRRFTVPSGLTWNTDYHVILFLDTGADYAGEESQQNNWIPLRGTVHVKPMMDCVSLEPGPLVIR